MPAKNGRAEAPWWEDTVIVAPILRSGLVAMRWVINDLDFSWQVMSKLVVLE